MKLPSLSPNGHPAGKEKVSQEEEEGAGCWPKAEPGCHQVNYQRGEESPVAGQKPQADSRPLNLPHVPLGLWAALGLGHQGGVGEVIAAETAKEVSSGTEPLHPASKLEGSKVKATQDEGNETEEPLITSVKAKGTPPCLRDG